MVAVVMRSLILKIILVLKSGFHLSKFFIICSICHESKASVWFFNKNVSHVIFYYLTKFHCWIAFTSWDIGQYVHCNCLLTRKSCVLLSSVQELLKENLGYLWPFSCVYTINWILYIPFSHIKEYKCLNNDSSNRQN